MSPDQVRAARRDVGAFGRLIGCDLTEWQEESLRLSTRNTVITAPRQTGKSRSLSVLSLWWAFRKPRQQVLIISASEAAARRLLSTVRNLAAHPALAASVVDESAGLLTLSNGSVIRSVPASERAVRGWTVNLLVLDEAALIADELLAAALPTTAADEGARIVVASSPWGAGGWFYDWYCKGREGAPYFRTYVWHLQQALWIGPQQVESARASMTALRFAAEYEGKFVGAADAFFSRDELLACVAPYNMLHPLDAAGEEVVLGCDWARAHDRHAVAALGVLEDFGHNPEPVVYLAWAEISQRTYAEQVEAVAGVMLRKRNGGTQQAWAWDDLPVVDRLPNGMVLHETGKTLRRMDETPTGYLVRSIVSETNGVGAMPTEELRRHVAAVNVVGVHSTQRTKEDAFGRLRTLVSQRRLVVPNEPELLRQLLGLTFTATASGGLSIAAATEATHDDLPDAMALAVSSMTLDRLYRTPAVEPDGVEWVSTPGGVSVPLYARPRKRGLSSNRQQLVSW